MPLIQAPTNYPMPTHLHQGHHALLDQLNEKLADLVKLSIPAAGRTSTRTDSELAPAPVFLLRIIVQ